MPDNAGAGIGLKDRAKTQTTDTQAKKLILMQTVCSQALRFISEHKH